MNNKQVLLDTNIFLRLLIGDISHQFEQAKAIIASIEKNEVKGYVSLLVINEIVWILQRFYKKSRLEFISQILQLLSLKGIITLEVKKSDVMLILDHMLRSNLDFTDIYLLHFGKTLKMDIASFDKNLLKYQQK